MILILLVLSIFWVISSILYVILNIEEGESNPLFLFYPSIKRWCDNNEINNFGRFVLYSLSTLILLPGVIISEITLLIIYLSLLCINETINLFIYLFKRK